MLEKRKKSCPEEDNGFGSDDDPTDPVLPVAKPKRGSQEKMYEGRRFWTDAEKAAVIEGIKTVGVGRWAEIKKKYHEALEFRTSGQIKVRGKSTQYQSKQDKSVVVDPSFRLRYTFSLYFCRTVIEL